VIHVHGVFFAFRTTGLADFGAKLANLLGELAAAGHETNGGVADFGAVAVEADALDHHLYILLAEAGIGAMVAGDGAGLTGFDTLLVRLMCHVRVYVGTPQ